jgi:toxin ParE1/3/4
MRRVAADPEAAISQDRGEILPGLRSFHLRHARREDAGDKVRRPARILDYRPIRPDVVEIIRILHERMDPHRHLFSP